MRIRHKPYARSELAAWPKHVNNPETYQGHWREFFSNSKQPLHLEVGCGKGGFLAQHALQNPNVNYLGIDLKSEMLVVAKRNIENLFAQADKPLQNIALTAYQVEHIRNLFSEEDAISRLYINFCNPWYKSGHAKHRLTHPRQLIQYRGFLHKDANIFFKTDDDILYEDSLRYFSLCAFDVIWQTGDLHREEPEWNIRTEHEKMFSEKGIPIKACILKMQNATLDEAALSRLKNI